MTDTKALREIAQAASPTGWVYDNCRCGDPICVRKQFRMLGHFDVGTGFDEAEASHIATFSPPMIAIMLDEIDALRDALAAKTEECEAFDALVEKRFNEIATLHAALASKDAELAAMRAKLQTIAGGMTSEFPGAPDVMATTPDQFRHGMWTWSQAVARAALAGEGKP